MPPIDPVSVLSSSELSSLLLLESDGSVGGIPSSVCSPVAGDSQENSTMSSLGAMGLLGVPRVPGTDCGLVYGWLGACQYVLLLSVIYALVSNLLGNGDSLTLTSA